MLTLCAAVSAQEPASNPNVEKLLTTRECKGCDFTKTAIVNKDLAGVNLMDANFDGGSLYACDLTGANLSGANLRTAVLRRSDLKGANLGGADLSGADLSFAQNASFEGAITTSSTICPDGSNGPCR